MIWRPSLMPIYALTAMQESGSHLFQWENLLHLLIQERKTPSEEDTKEPAVVDVISWYELIGRQMLESVITDLNANGHSRLSIKENGDIIITRNKKEALKGTLDQFPPKNYWNEFLNLLEEQELHGKVEKDRIIISWV